MRTDVLFAVVLSLAARLSLAERASLDVPPVAAGAPHRRGAPSKAEVTGDSSAACGKDCRASAGSASDFDVALRLSKEFLSSEELNEFEWVHEHSSSGGGKVPAPLLRAEELLDGILPSLPEDKVAKVSLQLYNHAKWLAEQHVMGPAERRYLWSATLARESGRTTLAAHSLARLGYFLLEWNRKQQAHEVLQQAFSASESNGLARFLLGKLERENPGRGRLRLDEAEALILTAGEQPSEELEQERLQLVSEISFWRQAATSPKHCLAAADVAK
eukprot:CAMPEP_0178415776 /NCGR_PEP_ID=MMETSP0689_2-20121128/23725_1 /TAXON_ID=160604 /ORGANISM="Amphidinium massartii, Strain CS-259" /LENGTH=273 /DNA_ID=CAMNT_0020037105 /DNA_START=115 /DNA_END=933 /DNA_ORIENTATION=-